MEMRDVRGGGQVACADLSSVIRSLRVEGVVWFGICGSHASIELWFGRGRQSPGDSMGTGVSQGCFVRCAVWCEGQRGAGGGWGSGRAEGGVVKDRAGQVRGGEHAAPAG